MNLIEVRRGLLRAFWAGVVLLGAYALAQGPGTAPLLLLLGVGIAAFALLPSYLWCAGRVDGLPVFPLFALTHIWTFALPLLLQYRPVARYAAEAQTHAALTAMTFLGVATAAWLWAVRGRARALPSYWGFAATGNNAMFLAGILLALAVQGVLRGGYLPEAAGQFASMFNSISLSLTILCVTVLSHRLGQRQLRVGQRILFVALLASTLLVSATGLVLAPGLATIFVAVGVFTISRGRVPLVVLTVAFAIFSILHLGKWPMRQKYWGNRPRPVQPHEVPEFYAAWFGHGLDRLPAVLAGEKMSGSRSSSLLERGSLLQMLLLVQSKSPNEKPFLEGKTYAIIPELLVPRFLKQDKIRAHEGTYILSIYYGLQSRSATRATTIGFGLLSESYANFGQVGVLGLSLLVGLTYGLGARWAANVPITSLRGLFALLLLASALQVEATAGVITTSLFQSSVTLLGLALVAMGPQKLAHSPPAPVFVARPVPAGGLP